MAKELFFSVTEPMSTDLARRMWQFLIDATAKREQVTVAGALRERSPDTGEEAS